MRWLLLALLLQCCLAHAQTNPFPQVARAYQLELDQAVLWEQGTGERLPPASLTKLMTALLVVDSVPLDAEVIISRPAAVATGSGLRLRPEQRFTVDAMLRAMLLHSANDACRALAETVAGSERQFVKRINDRALEMALTDTRFSNACGHDAPGHYSTARDLAVLARHVLQHSRLRALIGLDASSITTLDGQRHYRFANSNALIGRYAGIAGVKTGYTARAGNCLIAYAVRGRREVLLVLLNAPNRWWDAVDMLDLAFSHAAR